MGLGVTALLFLEMFPECMYVSPRMVGGGGALLRWWWGMAAELGVIMGLDRRRFCKGELEPDFVGEVTETPAFVLSSFLMMEPLGCCCSSSSSGSEP